MELRSDLAGLSRCDSLPLTLRRNRLPQTRLRRARFASGGPAFTVSPIKSHRSHLTDDSGFIVDSLPYFNDRVLVSLCYQVTTVVSYAQSMQTVAT